jgi:hypothetical protein
MTPDQQRAEIVAMACAHVTANCNWREANRLAVAQHAHLLSLMAKEQPESNRQKLGAATVTIEQPQVKTVGKVWRIGGKLYTKSDTPQTQVYNGQAFLWNANDPDVWLYGERSGDKYPILRELTEAEAEAYRKEQQQ